MDVFEGTEEEWQELEDEEYIEKVEEASKKLMSLSDEDRVEVSGAILKEAFSAIEKVELGEAFAMVVSLMAVEPEDGDDEESTEVHVNVASNCANAAEAMTTAEAMCRLARKNPRQFVLAVQYIVGELPDRFLMEVAGEFGFSDS